MAGTGSGGHSASAGRPNAVRASKVTTPTGGHYVSNAPGKAPSFPRLPVVGTPQRGKARPNTVGIRAVATNGIVTPVQTAFIRQHAPTPTRVYGSRPGSVSRLTAPIR